ncbi:MAG TPA: tripartite tricarboxylate transporter substrate binding protein [Burkholderiales bacterium]|nr:tripartite tricarboxylate transporter substrate binding protein [Burkholderiales bacterium]
MKRMLTRAAGALLLAAATLAQAQDFPSRPLHIIVPWAPGGNIDITARVLAPALGEALGQSVVVDNRAGAGGTIGSLYVAKSAPDGYTLLLGSSGSLTASPAAMKNIPYDTPRDFTALGPIHVVPMVLTASPKMGVSTYAEFAAKARAGRVSVASAGNGSSNHLAIEMLKRAAGYDLVHVPYKGSGPALTDEIGGQVDAMVDQLTASIQYIREGRIKAIAMTSKARSAQLPNVPTLAESGLAGFDATTFTGLFAPANLPKPVADKLTAALRKSVAEKPVRDKYESMGVEMLNMSTADFGAFVRADFEQWRTVARDAHVVIE